MDGIKKLRNESTRSLQEIVARCRPYFDRDASGALPATERQHYYAALFLLAERGELLSAGWPIPDIGRPQDDRQRASRRAAPGARRDRAQRAA